MGFIDNVGPELRSDVRSRLTVGSCLHTYDGIILSPLVMPKISSLFGIYIYIYIYKYNII
jgi:hypothetical protein